MPTKNRAFPTRAGRPLVLLRAEYADLQRHRRAGAARSIQPEFCAVHRSEARQALYPGGKTGGAPARSGGKPVWPPGTALREARVLAVPTEKWFVGQQPPGPRQGQDIMTATAPPGKKSTIRCCCAISLSPAAECRCSNPCYSAIPRARFMGRITWRSCTRMCISPATRSRLPRATHK